MLFANTAGLSFTGFCNMRLQQEVVVVKVVARRHWQEVLHKVWKKKKVRLNVIRPHEPYSPGSEVRKRRCGLLFDSEEATTCEATAKGYCQVGEDRGTQEQTLENSCESSKQAKLFLSAVAQIRTHKLNAAIRNCHLNYFVINQHFLCLFP